MCGFYQGEWNDFSFASEESWMPGEKKEKIIYFYPWIPKQNILNEKKTLPALVHVTQNWLFTSVWPSLAHLGCTNSRGGTGFAETVLLLARGPQACKLSLFCSTVCVCVYTWRVYVVYGCVYMECECRYVCVYMSCVCVCAVYMCVCARVRHSHTQESLMTVADP